MQERLKNLYFGYWGFPTGRIRWGETIYEAAAPELREEIGLSADYEFMAIYREHRLRRKAASYSIIKYSF